MYNAPVTVGLSTTTPGSVIRYTLDGSVPTETSPVYSSPLSMVSLVGTGNTISNIVTSACDEYGPWQPPAGEVFKANILRARVFKSGEVPSKTISRTYFIDPAMTTRYSMPVVSLITESDNLFDDETGIYVPGNDPSEESANYYQRGDEWERDVHVEFIDGHLTGTPSSVPSAFAQDAGMRIHGGFTRCFARKSLRLYARSEYGESRIDYPVFGPDIPEAPESFKRLILRNGGNECYRTVIRDAFAHELVRNTDIAAQPHRPAIVFINGEYWGIHSIIERYDWFYMSDHYGVDSDEVDIITFEGFAEEGNTDAYCEMQCFLNSQCNDLTDPNTYLAAKALINIPNHITYYAAEIFIGNGDWPWNNQKLWRPRNGSRSWEWLFYDTDEAMFEADHNKLAGTAEETESAFVFTRLLTNTDYRQAFITRYADLLNTRFTADSMLAKLLETQNAFAPEMTEHIHRWQYPESLGEWNDSIFYGLQQWCLDRPEYAWQHLEEFFELAGRSQLTVNVNNTDQGAITLNTLGAEELTLPWTGTYFNDVPVTITAVPAPGYRFANWVGTSQTSPQISLYVTTNMTIAAVFEPVTAGPIIKINGVIQEAGAYVYNGDMLSMELPSGASGTIHYTLDGVDPWAGGGISPSASAYSSPITLTETVVVNARILDGGNWSDIFTGTFVVGSPSHTLRITEFMYNPADGGAEFIEIQNVGTESVPLLGIHFSEAITFTFPDDAVLAPGQFTVLVRDDDALLFSFKHPTIPIGGLYEDKLDNGGELVILSDGDGIPMFSFNYNDEAPWDIEADGLGYSLILIDPEVNPNNPSNWQASIPAGGTPGEPGGLEGQRQEEVGCECECEGGGGGDAEGPVCLTISPTDAGPGDEVTVIAYDENGEWYDLRRQEGVELCFGDAAGCVWSGGEGDESLDVSSGDGVFTITQDMLDSDIFDFACWPDEVWFTLANPGEPSPFDTVAEAIAAGGNCDFGPGGSGVPACLTISPTDAGPGDEVTLTAYDEFGEMVDLTEWTGGIETGPWDCGPSAGIFQQADEDGTVTFELTDCWYNAEGWEFYVFIPDPFQGGDYPHANVADAIAAGGTCDFGPGESGVPACLTINPTGAGPDDEVTLTAFDDNGEQVDLSEWGGVEMNFEGSGEDGFFILPGDPEMVDGSVVIVLGEARFYHYQWDFFTFIPDGPEAWLPVAMPDFAEGAIFDWIPDAVAAGGTCEGALCVSPPALDIDGDCRVGMYELIALADAWLDPKDFFDFAELASSWLDCGLDPPSACWDTLCVSPPALDID
ncbi:MAG: CotH kinase family protein, partial [Planctomycetota bacterium]